MLRCAIHYHDSRLTSVVVVLSACGGGGGGNGGGSASVITASAPITVTSGNAPGVAGATFDASDDLTGSGGGVSGLVAASVGGTRSADINVIDALIAQVRRAPGLLGSGASGVGPAAVAQVSDVPCDSGTFSGRFNDADNDTELTTGDSLTLTLNNCSFDGVVMNGGLTIDNVVVTGGFNSEPPVAPYSSSVRIQASNLSITDGGETVVMSGGGTISESTNDDVIFTSAFSGTAVRVVTNTDTLVLTDFNIGEIDNNSTGAYSISINGTISSSNVGGSVIVTTTVAFTGVGDLDPTGGQATCVGAGNTTVSLTANADGSTVQLQVDIDGDGIADDTIDETWVNL